MAVIDCNTWPGKIMGIGGFSLPFQDGQIYLFHIRGVNSVKKILKNSYIA